MEAEASDSVSVTHTGIPCTVTDGTILTTEAAGTWITILTTTAGTPR